MATDDGRLFTFPIPAAPVIAKQYVVSYPIKAKAFQYGFQGAGDLQIYQQDCEVRIKQWGVDGPFRSARPFGDLTPATFAATGARI